MTHHEEEVASKSRMSHWFAVAAFSTIALVSITSNMVGDISDQIKEVKWAVSAVSIALSFSALALLATMVLKDKFVGTTIETGMSVLTAGFWVAGLPAIMKPENNLAVSSDDDEVSIIVTNINLYFFSWAAFMVSFMIFFACISKTFAFGSTTNEETGERRCSRTTWAGMMVMGFVVMLSSSRIFQDRNCDADILNEVSGLDINAFCDRTKYGVAVGAIQAAIGLLWLITTKFFLKGALGSTIEYCLIWIMLVFWTCGVVYLTFDVEKAPASSIGNLYFFTWGSWALNVYMAMMSFENMTACDEETATDAPAVEDKKEPDVEADNADVEA